MDDKDKNSFKLRGRMKCQLCTKPHTYNLNCRACTVRWLKTLPDWYKRKWLKDYREKHGRDAMMEIIKEVMRDESVKN